MKNQIFYIIDTHKVWQDYMEIPIVLLGKRESSKVSLGVTKVHELYAAAVSQCSAE